jgi:hypothetical protein
LEGSAWYKQVGNRAPEVVAMLRAGSKGVGDEKTSTPTPSKPTAVPVQKPEGPKTDSKTSSGSVVTSSSGAPVSTASGDQLKAGNAPSTAPKAVPAPAPAPTTGNRIQATSTQNSDMKMQAMAPAPSAPIVVTAPASSSSGGAPAPAPSSGSDNIRNDESILMRLQYGIVKTV